MYPSDVLILAIPAVIGYVIGWYHGHRVKRSERDENAPTTRR